LVAYAFTFGASFEKYQFKNSFNLGGYDNFEILMAMQVLFFSPYFLQELFG
jgi:hypothetical protein